MISTVLQTAYYIGFDGTTSGNNVLKLIDYGLGPSNVTMQTMLTSVYSSGGAPVSATTYVDYYIANGLQVIPPGNPSTVSATGVTEIGLKVDLQQGGNAVVGALLVFVSA